MIDRKNIVTLRKADVRFPAEGGIELSAWLFVPPDAEGNLPAITMTHGFRFPGER
jgi:cephalosporin-C deacetylase-like acetyl esterase